MEFLSLLSGAFCSHTTVVSSGVGGTNVLLPLANGDPRMISRPHFCIFDNDIFR